MRLEHCGRFLRRLCVTEHASVIPLQISPVCEYARSDWSCRLERNSCGLLRKFAWRAKGSRKIAPISCGFSLTADCGSARRNTLPGPMQVLLAVRFRSVEIQLRQRRNSKLAMLRR